MPLAKTVWTSTAAKDRLDQLLYIEAENPRAALRLDFEIQRQTDLLCDFPEMGRPGRVPDTRELVISRTPYVVIYRARVGNVQILRLLHAAQLWP